MSEMHLLKMPGGYLRPANQHDSDRLDKVKNGALLTTEIKQPRNPRFLRKFFALLDFGFEYWEPPAGEWNGIQAEKNFDKFRDDVTIYAGFYIVVTNLKGETQVKPKSISFASMEETEFAEVYQAVFNVIWKLVLSKVQGMTPEQAENTINQVLSYD